MSSVRSSNSHPDVLVTHHHQQPPFFKSHWSSALDFHFLSHNSYIKGKHLTHLLATCMMVHDGARWCKMVQDSAIPCNTMQYHAIPCNTMQNHAKPCNTMQNYAIPCNTMQYYAIPCNTLQYHAIPCNTMQHYSIQCNTMQYYASFMTADGAYHCPVGSIWLFFSTLTSIVNETICGDHDLQQVPACYSILSSSGSGSV